MLGSKCYPAGSVSTGFAAGLGEGFPGPGDGLGVGAPGLADTAVCLPAGAPGFGGPGREAGVGLAAEAGAAGAGAADFGEAAGAGVADFGEAAGSRAGAADLDTWAGAAGGAGAAAGVGFAAAAGFAAGAGVAVGAGFAAGWSVAAGVGSAGEGSAVADACFIAAAGAEPASRSPVAADSVVPAPSVLPTGSALTAGWVVGAVDAAVDGCDRGEAPPGAAAAGALAGAGEVVRGLAGWRCGASTMIMFRPSCFGELSTTPSAVTSSASRCRSRYPSSGRDCSRPRNMMVTLTLSPALRKRTT